MNILKNRNKHNSGLVSALFALFFFRFAQKNKAKSTEHQAVFVMHNAEYNFNCLIFI